MAIDPNILAQVTGPHPARTMDFDTLYQGLQNEIQKGFVTEVAGPNGLTLYSYTIDCQFDNKWSLFSLISRGLVLDVANKKVVATPFVKFFNHGELPVHMPNGKVSTYTPEATFTVTEKVDGSLGIIFFHNNEWHCITRGSFKSDQGQMATAWLRKNCDTRFFNKNSTFLVEIIYPENRIVVPYDFVGLVLLSGYDPNGVEYKISELQTLCEASKGIIQGQQIFPQESTWEGFRLIKTHEFDSLDKMLETAKTLSSYEEGWVVRFSNGYRVKIKGDQYCKLHKLVANVTPNRVWETMLIITDLEDVRKQLPEEILKDFDTIVSIYNGKLEKLLAAVQTAHEQTKHLSDKECGLLLSEKFEKESVERSFIFPCRKMDFLNEVHVAGSVMRKKAFNFFKPRSNVLEGYVPSTAMNRFDPVE